MKKVLFVLLVAAPAIFLGSVVWYFYDIIMANSVGMIEIAPNVYLYTFKTGGGTIHLGASELLGYLLAMPIMAFSFGIILREMMLKRTQG